MRNIWRAEAGWDPQHIEMALFSANRSGLAPQYIKMVLFSANGNGMGPVIFLKWPKIGEG